MSMTASSTAPALDALTQLALAQGGYFDRADALAHGYSDQLVRYHVAVGNFERVATGVYRLAIAPYHHHDELFRAVVWSNYRGVLSHESALELHDLSDLMAYKVHLTVPPEFRRVANGVQLHWSALSEDEITRLDGLPVTAVARTIVDVAVAGISQEHIAVAVQQALARALTSEAQLMQAAGRSHYRHRRRVLPLIQEAIRNATAGASQN